MRPNRVLRSWGLYLLAAAVAAACLLPVACTNNDPAKEKNAFSAVSATCSPTPHVCSADEINSDACPFSVEGLTLPDSADYEDDPVFDDSAEATFHKLTLDSAGNVSGENTTDLEGEYAWELLWGVNFWWQHHPENEKFVTQGIFDDDNPKPALDGLGGSPSPQDKPLYVTCDESVPFTVEIPGAIPPSQDALNNNDCYALAYGTGLVAKQWLENQGVDDHVLVSFPAPCPWIDDGGDSARPHGRPRGLRGLLLPKTKSAGRVQPNALPPGEQPHPNGPILGRTFSNFATPGGRRAWESAQMVVRNQQRGTAQIYAKFDEGATVSLGTKVIIVGNGPGGGTLATMYSEQATMLSNNSAWKGRPEYEVVQSRLSTSDFVNPNFRDGDLLDTNVIISNLHATTREGVVLGYQPGFMDYVMANATENHVFGTVTGYAIEEGELIIRAQLNDAAKGARNYQFAVPAGRRAWDTTGMLDTPRVRATRFDTTVPNQVGDPPMKAYGVTMLDSANVTTTLNARNLNVGDLTTLTPAQFQQMFNGQTAIVLGSGGAAFQTVGMLYGKSNAKILLVYNNNDATRTLNDSNLNQGESGIGINAFKDNDPRIIKRATTATLSDLGLVEGLSLGLVRVDPKTVSMELRGVPGLVAPDPVRADWMVSCAGPIDSATLIPMDYSVLNTLQVVNANLGGQVLPLYVQAAGGRLILDYNASTKVARYVVELARKGDPKLALPQTTLDALAALGAQRGNVNNALDALTGRRLAAYEQAAAGNAQIYRAVEGAPKRRITPNEVAPANDNRRVPATAPANDNRRVPAEMPQRRVQRAQ